MTDKPPLAPSCRLCVYYPPEGMCRRHAPSPGQDEFDLVHWPKVRPNDRCGDGAAITDGTGPGVVACLSCIHWHQPDGQPVKPDYRKGLPVEWWAASGYCTRLAPSPTMEEDQKVYWKVTHATDGCGDAGQIEMDLNDGAPVLEAVLD